MCLACHHFTEFMTAEEAMHAAGIPQEDLFHYRLSQHYLKHYQPTNAGAQPRVNRKARHGTTVGKARNIYYGHVVADMAACAACMSITAEQMQEERREEMASIRRREEEAREKRKASYYAAYESAGDRRDAYALDMLSKSFRREFKEDLDEYVQRRRRVPDPV